MTHLHRLLLPLFSASMVLGFWLWLTLHHWGHGHPPEGGFLRWWHDLEGQPEFHLLTVQLAYPIHWWHTRGLRWSRAWRIWRMTHLALVVLLIFATGLAWLTTPDLGGHWG
jgi:hypothetical protein